MPAKSAKQAGERHQESATGFLTVCLANHMQLQSRARAAAGMDFQQVMAMDWHGVYNLRRIRRRAGKS
jgi:hypothetical protein